MHNSFFSSTFAPAFEKSEHRDVAQSGSATVWGTGGRKFESCHPDKKRVLHSLFLCANLLRRSSYLALLERTRFALYESCHPDKKRVLHSLFCFSGGLWVGRRFIVQQILLCQWYQLDLHFLQQQSQFGILIHQSHPPFCFIHSIESDDTQCTPRT